jgi:hypothetical protein
MSGLAGGRKTGVMLNAGIEKERQDSRTGVVAGHEGPGDRQIAPASRIVLLEAALQRARSENARIGQRDADLRAELERVYAENRRLRAAVLDARQPASAPQPRFLRAHEMTAGTNVGPRRRSGSAPHPPRAVSST